MTHIDAEGHEVVGVEEVVGDWLSQVEGQLDEPEGGAGIRGGEDDPAWVVHHWYIRCQYHLLIKGAACMNWPHIAQVIANC